MSAISLVYLYCDGGALCPREDGQQAPYKIDPLPGESAADQRSQARLYGWLWKRKEKKDYCLVCAKRLFACEYVGERGE